MIKICQRYVQDVLEIYKNMPKKSQRLPKDMLKTIQNMPKIFQRYVHCTSYALAMSWICATYTKDVSKICPIY